MSAQTHRILFIDINGFGFSKLLILLPAARDCFLRLAQKEVGDRGFALLQHAVTTFGVDVVLKRDLRITRIELEWILILLVLVWVFAFVWFVCCFFCLLLLV